MSVPSQSAPHPDPEPKEPGRFEGAVKHAPASRSLEAPLTAGSCCAASHCLPPAHLVTPAQAWQGVLMAGSAMQRSNCPRSAVPRGCEKQARALLHPRTCLDPSAQGRAGVPTDSADSLMGAPVLTGSYFRFLCDKDIVSANQTSTHRVRSHYGPSPVGKPGLAGLAG